MGQLEKVQDVFFNISFYCHRIQRYLKGLTGTQAGIRFALNI